MKKILGNIEPSGTLYTRKEADDLFFKMMDEAGVSNWRRWFGYIGVRLFGGLYWKPKVAQTRKFTSLHSSNKNQPLTKTAVEC